MKSLINLLIIAIFSTIVNLLKAQTTSDKSDFFDNSGKIYVVVAVLVIIFLGILFMMYSIERRLYKIEKEDGDI